MQLADFLADTRQTDLAAAVGCQSQLIWQWSKGVRQTPTDRCPAIERATGGKVTCEEQRPDVVWRRIADPAWPWHPQGKPLVDVLPDEPAAASPTRVARRDEAKASASEQPRSGDRRVDPLDVTHRRYQIRRQGDRPC